MKKKILSYFLLFFYVYKVCFSFFPGRLKTSMLIGAIGFIYLVMKRKRIMLIGINKIAILTMPIFLWSIASMFINMQFDSYFPKEMILSVLYAMGAFFIIDYFDINSIKEILKMFLVVVLLNNFVAIGGLLIPAFKEFIVNIQSIESIYDLVGMARAVGLGNVFFGGGAITGLAMIFSCYLYRIRDISLLFFLLLIFILLVTGILIARTTVIGLIGLILIILPLKRTVKYVPYILTGLILSLSGLIYLRDYLSDELGEEVANFAFSMFIGFKDSGQISDGSIDIMKDMYNIIPDNIKTWFLGDGLWNTASGGYYMETDIGYFRIIFAMGLVGLFLYIFFQYSLMRLVFLYSDKNKDVYILMITIMIYNLILLGKGEMAFSNYLFLLFFVVFIQKKKCYIVAGY